VVTIEGLRAEGCGNAYLFVDAARAGARVADALHARAGSELPAWLARLGGPRLDGLILLEPDPEALWRLAIWNADGSRGEVCGNGLRAAALLARRFHGLARGVLATAGGRHEFVIESDGRTPRVRVTLPGATGAPESIPLDAGATRSVEGRGREPRRVALAVGSHTVHGFALSVGNPHFVVPCDAAPEGPLVDGPALERHAAFPARVNASWIWRAAGGRIGQRVFERGSGETAACGSGACAGAVVARHIGWCGPHVVVAQPGGELSVEVGADELALCGTASIGEALRLEL
jgi:diaminopimelate epimerase